MSLSLQPNKLNMPIQNRRYSRKDNPNVPEVSELGHLQPQAPDLEKAVLGALMVEQDAYSLVSEILRP